MSTPWLPSLGPSLRPALRFADTSLQRLSERALRWAPPPIEMTALEPLRAERAERIFARRRAEVERAHQLYAEGRRHASAHPPSESAPSESAPSSTLGGNAGLDAIARLAAEMVTELRVDMAHRTEGGLLGLAARIDAALPTEALEHLDDPRCDEAVRTRSIRALDRLNRMLGSYVRFLDQLVPLLSTSGTTTVLDLASGHGGFPLALAALARARGLRLRIIATDLLPEYLDVGRERAARLGETDVEFRVVDAFRLSDAVAPGEVDVVTCTQSLHHFGAGPLAALVAASLAEARRGILFIDPLRSLSRLAGITALAWLSTFNPWFVHDGVISVRKSFVPEELRLIARCAPGGERLEAFYLQPGFVGLRSRPQ